MISLCDFHSLQSISVLVTPFKIVPIFYLLLQLIKGGFVYRAKIGNGQSQILTFRKGCIVYGRIFLKGILKPSLVDLQWNVDGKYFAKRQY